MAGPHSRHFAELLIELSEREPDREFVVDRHHRITYGEFRTRASSVARGLYAFGVRPGDRVALLLSNRIEWLDVAFGAFELGATLVPLSTWYRSWDLEYALRHCEPKILLTMAEFRGNRYMQYLSELAPELVASDRTHLHLQAFPSIERVVGLTGDGSDGVWTLKELLTAGDGVEAREVDDCRLGASPHDLAYILYTSGTTSTPKGVMVEHHACIENGYLIGERQHLTFADRLWLAVSLAWGLGSENALPALMTHGGTMVLQEFFEPGEALRIFRDEKISVFYGMPNMVHALIHHPDRLTTDRSSLRTGVMIGSPEEVRRAAEDLGVSQICNVYGSTETYGNCCVTDAADPLEVRMNCQGQPLPGMDVHIVNPQSREVVGPEETGDILVGGRIVPGYWNDRLKTADAFHQGSYITGDSGFFDGDGRLHFVGRFKDMIKTGGINVAPAEVEDFLMTHPKVNEAYVLGISDPDKSQIVVAVIQPVQQGELSVAELIEFCRARIASYKIPVAFYFVTEADVPRTVTGKVNKIDLLAMVQSWAAAAAGAPPGAGAD
jgi:fatty-acyl-CoA synthase